MRKTSAHNIVYLLTSWHFIFLLTGQRKGLTVEFLLEQTQQLELVMYSKDE